VTDCADTHGRIFKKSVFDREIRVIRVQILTAPDEMRPNLGKNKVTGFIAARADRDSVNQNLLV
jgi:hypothetical protein